MNRWMNETSFEKTELSPWLTEAYNLTESLKETGMHFSLRLLEQAVGTPHDDEIAAFTGVDATKALVRKVVHEANTIPYVFARVIVPMTTYLNYKNELDSLGNSPIGNTLLYQDPQIIREPFEYKQITQEDSVFEEITRIQKDIRSSWARRSIFQLPKGTLLISEYYLNNLPLLRYSKSFNR